MVRAGGALVIGQRIGHYRLEEKLGRGGFGTVYRAVHEQLPSLRVAIKVVHDNLAADEGFQRLLRKEVEVLHGLRHPGIVGFRDLLITPDATAIVLDLLEGMDLRHALMQGPFSPTEVARILWELLSALAAAHDRGVVHRDIKPENIFLCSDGRLELMDFGIAKVAHSTLASQSGMVSGTLDYMAPERFQRESPPSSDLYSLGLVAWELLTGRLACPDGDIPAKIGWHLGRGAPDVRELRPDCHGWLAELVSRLHARDVEDRPLDAAAALALLEEVWPPPGPRGSAAVEPRTPEVGAPPRPRRGPSGPTLAPSLAGLYGDLPLAQKSTPTWAPPADAAPRPSRPPAVVGTREPRSDGSPAAGGYPTVWERFAPRGLGLVLSALALVALVGGILLAAGVASSAEPDHQVGTGLGVASLLATPGAAFFFFAAALVDGRALARALYFGLCSLAVLGTAIILPVAMIADGEELASALTGAVCCGGLPLVLPAVLCALFLSRGVSALRRDRAAWGARGG
jgi:serine/threonine protein kinase